MNTPFRLHLFLFPFLLALPVASQNVINNGNFDSGTTGWSISPNASNAKVQTSTITGVKGPALSFQHVAGSNRATISQIVSLPTKQIFLRFYFQATIKPGQSLDLNIELINLTTKNNHLSFSSNKTNHGKTNLDWEEVMAQIPWRSITGGKYELRLHFNSRGKLFIRTDIQIDRIELVATQAPMTYLSKSTVSPSSPTKLKSWGFSNSFLFQYIALKKLKTPIHISGLKGFLELSPSTLFPVGGGQVFSGGIHETTIRNVPLAIKGIPLYVQSLQFLKSNLKARQFGNAFWIAFR
jgi:hypothetical protein